MEQEATLLKNLKSVVIYTLLFLFPLFFLPFTQEFFATGKMYLLFFGALLLLVLATGEFLLTKKIVWEKKPLDNAALLFFGASVLSTLLSTPNKIQALLNPSLGVVFLFSCLILYFFASREKNKDLRSTLVYVAAIITSLVTVFYFFNPLKNVTLPTSFQFMKNQYFSLQGNLLETVIFLGFAAVLAFVHVFSKNAKPGRASALPLVSFVLSVIATGGIIFSFVKVKDLLILPPFNLSWYAAVETLKQPLTALFGVGVDNYSAMFTKVKDAGYNASNLWQIGSFNTSRSTLLHIFTEMGLLGLLSFALLLYQLVKQGVAAKKHHENKYALLPVVYIILAAAFMPPSITLLFLVFSLVIESDAHGAEDNAFTLDTGKILPLYAGIVVIMLAFIGISGYAVGRSYAAEIYFKQSVDGFAGNNVKTVYDNMRQAVMINPYIERFRTNFSQTNLLIANNVASKATPATEGEKKPELSEADRQTISQAIQAAIEEGKATVTLNPQKAVNWENLASIYRNIINVAQGADSWTVSAYQRAIILDPQNPTYRVSLGGVMFTFKNYDEAVKLFEQAVAIKPDWANSYYNLAWASFQKADYQRAAAAMQNTVTLLDPKKDEADYKRATADLEEFKKKLPKEEEATKEATPKSTKLSVPTPPAQSLEPKIKLPKEASPEAK
ncbi:tetratricopeptide repeat protein [Candidatus Roizmanbacteria bacterium]|nr:tetratricopeptide repeat protein [Candidatus Roizmanbacteria bacterium]